jgi:hypothetical protein
MPLEIAYRTDPTMRLNPPESHVGPLIGPRAAESSIDASGMGLKIVDQPDRRLNALRIDLFRIGFTTHDATQLQDQRESGAIPLEFRIGAPDVVWKLGVS